MNKFIAWLAAPALLLLSSCATAEFNTKLGEAPSIVGSQVYIYSFLDVRQDELGTAMISHVNQQLSDRLRERGVTAQVVTYRETAQGRYTARSGSVWVPVQDIVASRRAEEQSFGADYRIIIMPSQMTIYEAAQSYEVIWEVVDTGTDEIIWSTNMRGSRTVWYSHDEDAEGRATTFVNGVIEEMTRSGMFTVPAAGPPPTPAS